MAALALPSSSHSQTAFTLLIGIASTWAESQARSAGTREEGQEAASAPCRSRCARPSPRAFAHMSERSLRPGWPDAITYACTPEMEPALRRSAPQLRGRLFPCCPRNCSFASGRKTHCSRLNARSHLLSTSALAGTPGLAADPLLPLPRHLHIGPRWAYAPRPLPLLLHNQRRSSRRSGRFLLICPHYFVLTTLSSLLSATGNLLAFPHRASPGPGSADWAREMVARWQGSIASGCSLIV